ncbi:GFA family protein [Alteromonas sp. KUL106]|uniref:GFA family protein n=1 Tax=Alteromonas sp. KUL106 TaxID=2480799 RepID=UPI0012E5A9D7|nr:GFA family protein [Alteromonas sp. KUL106]GFD67667.1 aldehyde-activating protein [Alteromonas sp. KUL106]
MNSHEGSCLCGAVAFEIQGDFNSFYLCHCKHCQKDTGAAFAANLFSQSATLTWLSGVNEVTTFVLKNTRHHKSFCKTCGSALPSAQPNNMLAVPAGCLDTKHPMKPTAHIFCASKAAWEECLETITEFERLP